MAEFQAEITLDLGDERLAEALSRALEPDNKAAPEGLRVEAVNRGTILRIEAAAEDRPESLQATLDDLILCLKTAYNSLLLLTR
ncbi:MAG: KEOPS complex subunit Pcc1 [Candidatus Bathyarchaeia archaeon]|nr:CTAG/PCC1 family protein [Candidatus Bathyarchaeota archaeon]